MRGVFIKFGVCMGLLLASFNVNAQTAKQVIANEQVSEVTVYFYGAELTTKSTVNLAAGKNEIIFRQLSPNMNPNTIQVGATGNAKILSVTHQVNHLEKFRESERVRTLRDSVELLQFQIQQIRHDKNVYEEEKSLLMSNKSIGGQEKGVSVDELRKAADFYRTRLKDINQNIFSNSRREGALNTSLSRVQQQLQHLTSRLHQNPPHEIVVTLMSDRPRRTEVSLKYQAGGAGWAPDYAIRATNVNSPVQMEYRANVFNNTGIDWEEVKLSLTTADPRVKVDKPVLSPWSFSYAGMQKMPLDQGRLNIMRPGEVAGQNQMFDRFADEMEDVTFTEVIVSELSVNFDIKTEYTIPSDARPYLVEIQEHTLEADFEHYTVPKMEKDAYLIAKVKGWRDLNIVDGPVSIYYAGMYIGESEIQTRFAGEELTVSMGRDKNLNITRVKGEDRVSSRFMGTTATRHLSYEINIRNDHSTPVTIVVLDQVPISQDENIEIEATEISGANYNQSNGQLKWRMTVGPSETKTLTIAFSIKYPKDKPFEIERPRRELYSPRF